MRCTITGLVRAFHQERYGGGAVYQGEGEGDAVRVEVGHPVGDHEAFILLQRFTARKEGRRVSVVAHTEQDQVEDGDIRNSAWRMVCS